MTTCRAPVVSYEYAPGEWTEPMTTDVLVEQFDCGDLTEREADDLLLAMAVGGVRQITVGRERDGRWNMTLRREA